ncbi:hypothetical protein ACNS7O_16465 (plasmid) [Haloferacaceae archaeon DSL9]
MADNTTHGESTASTAVFGGAAIAMLAIASALNGVMYYPLLTAAALLAVGALVLLFQSRNYSEWQPA